MDVSLPRVPTPIDRVIDDRLKPHGVELWLKRDDLTRSHVMGNKWRKLKYNLSFAREQGYDRLATFGGAYSNHIYATAAAGHIFGFKTFGFIRGEEHKPLNSVLEFATTCGMELTYIDRSAYRDKHSSGMESYVLERCGSCYILPEGGTNSLAVKGCEEIVQEISIDYDVMCCACGTGGTLAGLIRAISRPKIVLGFPALKNAEFLINDIRELVGPASEYSPQWSFAKSKPPLTAFMDKFTSRTGIPLDPIYTGKMLFGIYDLIERRLFKPGTRIVAIHTGGYHPALQ
jgi:1-aminocyclopropane-1-carboxylate deaminase